MPCDLFSCLMSDSFPVVEKTIVQLRDALERGEVTCVELVKSYLRRIQTYDIRASRSTQWW